MEEFLVFLKDNWSFLVEVVLTLVVLLIAIFKKKVSVKCPEVLYSLIPLWVSQAEEMFPGEKTGSQKLRYVVENAWKYLEDNLGFTVSSCRSVTKAVVEQVEQILSCPTKKEK